MAKGKSVIINMDKDKGVIWEPAPTPVPALPSDGFGAQVSVPPLRWFGCPGLSAPASIGWFGCACPCATGTQSPEPIGSVEVHVQLARSALGLLPSTYRPGL
ncbi:hypothetical protein BDA96_09G120700 [Sorghum bicolor]|nr:hypothetical protein BDA96_09G120700 [Sorghum bicolor]OQU77868.1 hypothetical protein SORBI_3009G115050 [Sorghum bicolor]